MTEGKSEAKASHLPLCVSRNAKRTREANTNALHATGSVPNGLFREVDGPHGVEIIPCDVVNANAEELARIVSWPKQGDCEDNREIPGPLAQFCNNTWAYTIEHKTGWIGRMSAPGYLDATDWTSGDTEAEVRASLKDDSE